MCRLSSASTFATQDVKKLLQLVKKYSKDIHVWGDSIIGAGKLLYQSKSQKPYTWFQCGIAPRTSSISLYLHTVPLTTASVAKAPETLE
eukprot:Skav206316  [mRNA]  locus=scaffold4961:5162:6028:+ [translate_table: standard]